MIAFLEKPAESNGFYEIIDFLNANQIHYALTVNPTIYTSCIEQFWATAKAKTVNGERQLQALVDKKKVIIMETRIRSDLHLEDAGGIDCLSTATIFKELAQMGAKSTAWNEFSSTMASAIICLATNQKFNFSKYIFDAMVKHLEGGVRFLMYPRFVQVFLNNQLGDMSHHKKIYVNPSHIKKIFSNMKREGKDFSGRVTPLFATMMVQATQDEGVDSDIPTDSQQTPIPTKPSSSRPQKKQSRRKLKFLNMRHIMMIVFLYLPMIHFSMVLDLEKVKDAQAKEIAGLKKRVESSEDKDSLGAQEDASKQGRNDLHGDEVIVDMAVGEKQEQSAKVDEREVSTGVKDSATGIEDSAAPTIPVTTAGEGVTATKIDEITTTKKTTSSSQASQPSKTKDKGKAIMIEPEVPLKNKDQVALDEEMARNLKAQLQAELIEEEKLARKKEKEANIAFIESWENTQSMMEADRLLVERLQIRKQKELADEEKAKVFMEFMEKRRKHFAALRAQEKRKRPHTKT
ncbi:hypothetical protein Tco_0833626 [Tanacetum coccineum]